MSDFSIGRKQLYILPTRVGWYYALVLMALFGIAIKFDNQSAFIMLFILVSVGLVAMIYTHNNVIGLTISSHPSKPVFLGQSAVFPVTLNNESAKARHAVWLIAGGFHQLSSLNKSKQQIIDIKLPTVQRGYLNCETIHLTSMYPIGVFFCWSKRFKSSERCLVYPQAIDLIGLPQDNSQQGKDENNSNLKLGSEDYAGMKAYQDGDRMRDIHWPSLAKTNKLVSIEYESLSNSSVNLSWFSLPAHLGTEDKLSQLCFWVIEAEKSEQRYQLEMPNQTIEFDKGQTHFHECLRALALWGETPAQAQQVKPTK